MWEIIKDALLDSASDTAKLIPFLFITYIIMEALERKTGEKSASALRRVGKWGPAAGGLIGIVPQCGFSAAASSLYSGGVITVGTLIAVFLSTSDEMLPIFISEQVPVKTMAGILLAKALIGMGTGFLIDAVAAALRKLKRSHETSKHIRDLCEDEHCGTVENEDESILKAALIHTLHIVIFVFIISFVLTLLVEWVGHDRIASILTGAPVVGVLIAALIGLIPNCAASVAITQLYLEGLLGAGQMMAGLLVGAGVGLLVLFRTNERHLKENIQITILLYLCGVIWGLIIEALGITF